MIEPLLAELSDLETLLQGKEDIEEEAVDALLARVRDAAPTSTKDEIRALDQAVKATEAALLSRFERVGGELKKLQRGRAALDGYNHLRGFDQGQRLYRQA
jgi:hypothetical protein